MDDDQSPSAPDHKKPDEDIHDPEIQRPFHQMDTNGFTGHDELREQVEKRFNRAAMAFMYHVTSGGHEQCVADDVECRHWQAMIDAYAQVITV